MLSPGHGRCFYPWWAGAANWLLGLAMPSSQIRRFIHGKKRNVQSHWGSGQTLGDSQDRQAQKVPKAKIMGASTLSACLASVALPLEWAWQSCHHPEPVPCLLSSCTPSLASTASPPVPGREIWAGGQWRRHRWLGWPLSRFGDEGWSWESQRVPTAPAPWGWEQGCTRCMGSASAICASGGTWKSKGGEFLPICFKPTVRAGKASCRWVRPSRQPRQGDMERGAPQQAAGSHTPCGCACVGWAHGGDTCFS